MADKNFVVKNGLVVNTAFSANSSGLYFNDTLSVNSSVFKGTANNTSYVGAISAANVVSNAQLTANLSSYVKTSDFSTTVATLTSNNSNYLNNKTEANLNVNSAVRSTNATYATTAGSISVGGTIYSSSSTGINSAFNSIPVTAKRIKVLLIDVYGNPYITVQLGYDGNWLTNGYDCVSSYITNAGTSGSGQFYQGFGIYGFYAGPVSGTLTLDKYGSGTPSTFWVGTSNFSSYQYNGSIYATGRVALGGSTQQPSSYYSIRVIPSGGGSLNGSFTVLWE